jgi:hypothetical protein
LLYRYHNAGLDDDKALERALALSARGCPVSDIPEKRIPKRLVIVNGKC